MQTIQDAIEELDLIEAEAARLINRERTAPERTAFRVMAWQQVNQRIHNVGTFLRTRAEGTVTP